MQRSRLSQSRRKLLGGELHVGVRKHNRMVLRSPSAARAVFDSLARPYIPSNRSRTDNDSSDIVVIEQCIDSNFVAVRRSTPGGVGLAAIRRALPCRWISFRWLQHEGISACDCNWRHPHRHHRRKVEWRDSTQTPSGWRNVYESTPPETDRNMRLSSTSA